MIIYIKQYTKRFKSKIYDLARNDVRATWI